MTAKDKLRDRVGELSEAEAVRVLASLDDQMSEPILIPGELAQFPPEEQARRLRAMFDEWEAEGGYMTEEEWEEFARNFDAQRPHRPLFSDYLT